MDGYADVLIGAEFNDNNGGGAVDKGAAYLFYGSATGMTYKVINTTPYTCSGVSVGCTEIQNPNNELGEFSVGVAYSGDVNGDGYPDVSVGSYRNDNQGSGTTDKGAAYIYYGGSTGPIYKAINTTPYTCSGVSVGCTEIQNPYNETGNTTFGTSVALLHLKYFFAGLR